MGPGAYGVDPDTLNRIAGDAAAVHGMGVELCIVIGGGNIFRGVSEAAGDIERASADYMGMLATVINAIAMQNALERQGVPTRVFRPYPWRRSANPTSAGAPCAIWRRAGW